MTILDLWEALKVGGLPLAFLLTIAASMQGRFVWRREHDALEARRLAEGAAYERRLEQAERERDEWQRAFLRVAGVAESVAALALPDGQVRR